MKSFNATIIGRRLFASYISRNNLKGFLRSWREPKMNLLNSQTLIILVSSGLRKPISNFGDLNDDQSERLDSTTKLFSDCMKTLAIQELSSNKVD